MSLGVQVEETGFASNAVCSTSQDELEMQDELAVAKLRHNSSHFQGQPPYSSSQTWLHIRITWGSLTNYHGLAPIPAIQIQLVWGATWVVGVINAAQVILNCSHIWEELSSSFFSVT